MLVIFFFFFNFSDLFDFKFNTDFICLILNLIIIRFI